MRNKMKMIKGYDGFGFYIKKVGDYILVISNQVSNPFEYIYQLGKEIDKLSKNTSNSQVKVIFDLTPFLRRKTIFSLNYDKNKKILDMNSKKDLSENEIPLPVKNFLASYLPQHKKLKKRA